MVMNNGDHNENPRKTVLKNKINHTAYKTTKLVFKTNWPNMEINLSCCFCLFCSLLSSQSSSSPCLCICCSVYSLRKSSISLRLFYFFYGKPGWMRRLQNVIPMVLVDCSAAEESGLQCPWSEGLSSQSEVHSLTLAEVYWLHALFLMALCIAGKNFQLLLLRPLFSSQLLEE